MDLLAHGQRHSFRRCVQKDRNKHIYNIMSIITCYRLYGDKKKHYQNNPNSTNPDQHLDYPWFLNHTFFRPLTIYRFQEYMFHLPSGKHTKKHGNPLGHDPLQRQICNMFWYVFWIWVSLELVLRRENADQQFAKLWDIPSSKLT